MKTINVILLMGVGVGILWYYRYRKGTDGLISLDALPPPPTRGDRLTADFTPPPVPIIDPLNGGFNPDANPGFRYGAHY